MDVVGPPSLLDALVGPDGPTVLVVAQGRVTRFSPAAQRLLGPALVTGAPVLSFFDEASRAKLSAALASTKAQALELYALTTAELPIPMRFLVAPHGDEHVLQHLGLLRDPSGRLYEHLDTLLSANDQLTNLTRELSIRKQELAIAYEKLEALNQLREQDAATLSHDIKSPLSAIELQARSLERQAETLRPQTLRERAEAIRRTVRVLLNLVTQVLDEVRLDSGKLELSL